MRADPFWDELWTETQRKLRRLASKLREQNMTPNINMCDKCEGTGLLYAPQGGDVIEIERLLGPRRAVVVASDEHRYLAFGFGKKLTDSLAICCTTGKLVVFAPEYVRLVYRAGVKVSGR